MSMNFQSSGDRAWHAIGIVAGKERLASQSVASAGFRTFVPLVEVQLWNGFTYRRRVQGFFKGYGFAEFDGEFERNQVRWCRGVNGIVDFGSGPPDVEEALLREISARVGGDGFVQLDPTERSDRIAQGTHVDVIDGAWFGYQGIFQADCKVDRAIVLLKILGAERPIEVPRTILRPAFA